MKKIIAEILQEVRIELIDEFDKNFQTGSFFGKTWQKKQSGQPSHLIQHGTLKRSIRASVAANTLTFTSSEPYAAIHNEGGQITITEKMKRFFWAKYFENAGKTVTKKGNKSKSKSAAKASSKADLYRSLALKKIGSKLTIPQRQFIGANPKITTIVQEIANKKMQEFAKELAKNINAKIKK